MKKIRFLTKYLGEDGKEIDNHHIVLESEALTTSVLNGDSPETIWLSRFPRTIVLLPSASSNFIDLDYIKEINYPIVRDAIFPTNSTAIVIVGTGFILNNIIKDTTKKILHKYTVDFFKHITKDLVDLVEEKNDLVVSGTERKMVGIATMEKGDYCNSIAFFSESVPNVNLERIFKMPPSKFDDKKIKTVSERITSFEKETGKLIDSDLLKDEAIKFFTNLGFELEFADDFNKNEYLLIDKLKEKHLSEEWIITGYAPPKPDFI